MKSSILSIIRSILIKTRLIRTRLIRHEKKCLNALATIPCDAGSLCLAGKINLRILMNSNDNLSAWQCENTSLESFGIVDGTGGVNPGDRRAIFYLVHQMQPISVLEVGTHIGASTLHIASALSAISKHSEIKRNLLSVDINDVNSSDTKPWLKYDSSYSPAEMMRKMNFDSFVKFTTQDSIDFLSSCPDTYDFIFLDGNHAASTVYKEVPAALKLLNPGGIILLHDYFPGLKPLWSNGSLIPGPFLAIKRLRNEGAKLHVLPIGGLPWPTKLGSNLTSLALLLQDQ